MKQMKKSIWEKVYLLVFALLEGTKVDQFVRRSIWLLEPERDLEYEVKTFYIKALKSILQMLSAFGVLGAIVREWSFTLFLLLCTLMGWVIPIWELKRKVAKRARELQGEYEQMVSRLLLYMGAGLSVQNAFCKTALVLENGKADGYICREMKLCLTYMKAGKLEAECYYLFGQRCDLPEYLRLGGLLAQNTQKGNAELRTLLEGELLDAKERQRHQACRQKETASTKMLGPMMLLLALVLIMIMIPAFGSLG